MICNNKLIATMDRLGFAEHLSGTEYIRTGVAMVDKDRSISMTKELYPALGRAVGKSPSAIERSIRSALESARQSPVWDSGWAGIGGTNRPTNAELLHRLARESRHED